MILFFEFPAFKAFFGRFLKYRFPGISWNFNISCTRFLTFQEDKNHTRASAHSDCQESKRTSCYDQPFGKDDSLSEGRFGTFGAHFSRPAAFDPYVDFTAVNLHYAFTS